MALPIRFDSTTLPVRGSSISVPVRRVWCVGKNYAKHALELGCDPANEPPVFFTKQPTDIVYAGECRVPTATVPFPAATELLHHEVELVVIIGKDQPSLRDPIPVTEALDFVYGYCVGLDMTRRDIQNEARASNGPWDLSKSFDNAAPCGEVVLAKDWRPNGQLVACSVNGTERQRGSIDEMIWKVEDIIHHLSTFTQMRTGDIIFTGTPQGVGSVSEGDVVVATVEGLPSVVLEYSTLVPVDIDPIMQLKLGGLPNF